MENEKGKGRGMTDYAEIEGAVFRKATVWVNVAAELRWYRWAWPFVEPLAEREGALLVAATLVYFYLELCGRLSSENYTDNFWDTLDEYGIGDCEEAQARVTALHPHVASALLERGEMDQVNALHASLNKPLRITDESEQEDMIVDDATFLRYVADERFRNEDVNFAGMSEYGGVIVWLGNGAEMLEPRIVSDEW